jgi:excinuclease ABC subunit A
VSTRKGEYKDVFADAKAEGSAACALTVRVHDLQSEIKLNKKVKHSIEIVVDRLAMHQEQRWRNKR